MDNPFNLATGTKDSFTVHGFDFLAKPDFMRAVQDYNIRLVVLTERELNQMYFETNYSYGE